MWRGGQEGLSKTPRTFNYGMAPGESHQNHPESNWAERKGKSGRFLSMRVSTSPGLLVILHFWPPKKLHTLLETWNFVPSVSQKHQHEYFLGDFLPWSTSWTSVTSSFHFLWWTHFLSELWCQVREVQFWPFHCAIFPHLVTHISGKTHSIAELGKRDNQKKQSTNLGPSSPGDEKARGMRWSCFDTCDGLAQTHQSREGSKHIFKFSCFATEKI